MTTTSDLRAYLYQQEAIGKIDFNTTARVMEAITDRDREIRIQRERADKAEYELDRLRLILANIEEYVKNYDPAYAVVQIAKMLEG